MYFPHGLDPKRSKSNRASQDGAKPLIEGSMPSDQRFAGAIIAAGVILTGRSDAQEPNQIPLPEVTVTAPAPTPRPPYQRDPGKSYERNPYFGRNRVEEDKFKEVPCAATRIASATGGKCLQGYRLEPADVVLNRTTMGTTCELALDVVIFTVGSLSIEADTLIFDPYKLTAIGYQLQECYVNGHTSYDQQDFQDMNQVTRRGTNWHNLVGDGEDKSMEFSDGPRNCVAIKKAGPRWQGGYVYMVHASICRTDTAAIRAEDFAYALGSLKLRQHDPVGNLRPPP